MLLGMLSAEGILSAAAGMLSPDIFLVNDTACLLYTSAREPGGYGVKNIIDRLKIAYGYEYGLSCKSVPGAGTVVTIHIPAVIEISNE